MAGNFIQLKNIEVDLSKIQKRAEKAGDYFELENVLGNFLKFFSIVVFILINLYGIGKGYLPVLDLFLQVELRVDTFIISLCFLLFAYSLYLTRNKDLYHSLDSSNLKFLQKNLDKNPYLKINAYKYISQDFLLLINKVVKTQNNIENHDLLLIMKNMLDMPDNHIILKRLGIQEQEKQIIIQDYAKILSMQKNISAQSEIEILIKHAFLIAYNCKFEFVDERSLLLSFFELKLIDTLEGINVFKQDIDTVKLWLYSKSREQEIIDNFKNSSLFQPKGAVNRSMTNIKAKTLEKYCEDFSQYLKRYFIDARKTIKEIDISFRQNQLHELNTLLGSNESLIMIKGHTGVGKTTFINTFGIMQKEDIRIFKLNNTKVLSDFESHKNGAEIFMKLFLELKKNKDIVLLIEDFDQFLSLNDSTRNEIISVFLKEVENHKNELKLIITISEKSYMKYIVRNEVFNSFFSIIELKEPKKEISLQVLLDKLENFENKYDVEVDFHILRKIIDYSQDFNFLKSMPDRAVDFLHEIILETKEQNMKFVTENFVDKYFYAKMGVKNTLQKNKNGFFDNDIDTMFNNKLIGQDKATEIVKGALKRAQAQLQGDTKPLASFLFFGPTGVGKTYMAQLIAKEYLADQKLFLRLDMSEFQEEKNLDRLLGYVEDNFFKEGILTGFVMQHPFAVILLDELEKANPKVLDLFLQILDHAQIRDGSGQIISFKNTIIIGTSNVGSNYISKLFKKGKTYREVEQKAKDKLKVFFKVEFLNRFDGVIMFKPILKIEAIEIAHLLLLEEKEKLAQKGIEFIFDNTLAKHIVDQGYNHEYGVRELKRIIKQKVENKVADALLSGKLKSGDVFTF